MVRQWLAGREPDPHAGLRLFCLPYAGGGAAAYRTWPQIAPDHIEVCPLEIPGRGSRFAEPPFARLTPLVTTLARALAPVLDRPFALFGHSMGGLLAFELARTLRQFGLPQPEHLFVSGTAAPGTPPREPPLHRAPDSEVKRRLRALNGTPAEVLDDQELMALMLPLLRADFSVLETYEYREQAPLAVPITVFGGRSDPAVPLSALHGWRAHSTGGSKLRLFPGDHFYLHLATADLMGEIAHALR